MWSVGCIFAELLATLEPNAPRDSKRILFPGDSGYPVSATSNPDDVDDRRLERELRKPASMLTLIFSVLGTPTYQDIMDVLTVAVAQTGHFVGALTAALRPPR